MKTEDQIRKYAGRLLAQYGQDAWFHASQEADRMLATGDLDGNEMFRAILKRVTWLETLNAWDTVQ
jgi:hypothetical protein